MEHSSNEKTAIEIRNLGFRYGARGFQLRIPELHIPAGQHLALVGPSGSGKTTLIALIAGILVPQSGVVQVAGEELGRLSDRQRRAFRVSQVGFVFQEFELVEYLTVRDNILLPYYLNSALRLSAEVLDAVEQLARTTGLQDKLRRHPTSLSHGERQRVAICRALSASPALLIADEPTGNLDPQTAEVILDLLVEQARGRGATLLTVTHNYAWLERFDRTVDLRELAGGTS